ncbi:MAG: acetyl-CoA carboxylase biotin carboxyl carrier protein subunit [Anaerolineaceae bacterium]|nr:acetyl-CoA carboxylase biotin carboxyl carrier protein subunit [Anaerolineaceae bacterium]
MNYIVKIDNQTYTVAIGDLSARPIIATINDEQFEVWPELEHGRPAASASLNGTHPALPRQTSVLPLPQSSVPTAPAGKRSKVVRAPIPGTITEVLVQAGQSVTARQPLCLLEAMKMNNTIYAPHAGVIANVAVAVGQHVKHSDIMIEFAD